MRIGAIVFDPSTVMQTRDQRAVAIVGGWAAVAGGSAIRIQGISNLPSDVVWMTNLRYDDFRALRLFAHANFRCDGWLRSNFDQIARELGLETSTGKAKDTAEAMAWIGHRVIAYACREHGVALKSHYKLNDDYAVRLGLDRSRIDNAHHATFASVSEHPMVAVIQPVALSRNTAPIIPLRFNRLGYARHMLSHKVPPDTGWKLMTKAAPQSEWERMEQPFMVRCRITNVKEQVAAILGWGSGAKGVREWLTDVEYRTVIQYASVEVRSALVCEEPFVSLGEYAALLPATGLSDLSISLGLVAEQVWTSLMNKQPRIGDANGTTARAAWLRSIDRMTMFDFAMRMISRRNLPIMSYGMGALSVRAPEGALPSIIDTAVDVGLMPPVGAFRESKALASAKALA